MRLNFASCPLNAPRSERAAPPKLKQDFCSPRFFLLAVSCTAPTKHARSHACTRSHTRTCARARISAPAPARPEAQSCPPPPPPYHQRGWQGGGGSLRAGGGERGRRGTERRAASRLPQGLAPPSPSDSFRTDGVPNTSQGTPALPRPHPSPRRLWPFTKVITHCYTDSLYRGQKGRRSRGEKRAEGKEGRKEGGREGERLSASRLCRWREGVTSG